MNGKERFNSAFSKYGASEIPVCINYEHIYIRDHWTSLTGRSWWQMFSPYDEDKYDWQKEISKKIKQDWVVIPIGISRTGKENTTITQNGASFSITNDLTKEKIQFNRGSIIGDKYPGKLKLGNKIVETHDELELWFDKFCNIEKSIEAENDTITAYFYKPVNRVGEKGFKSLPIKINANWGKHLFPIYYLRDPVFLTYRIWGVEGMIMKMIDNPAIFKHACELFTKYSFDLIDILAKIKISAIYMACNLIGMIKNEDFKKYNLPYLQRICEKAKENNIKVIVNFLGDIKNKWDIILNCNADALAFEECKNGFIDRNIDEIVEKIQGRYVLFGNIDPISILEKGKLGDLRDQVRLQIKSGRKNNSRFVISLGGPITPNTEVKRVGEFIDIARQEIGKN